MIKVLTIIIGNSYSITGDYIPVGTRNLTLSSVSELLTEVGKPVIISIPYTAGTLINQSLLMNFV